MSQPYRPFQPLLTNGGRQSFALIQQSGDYFGIRFYPGALRHFFNLDLSEITGQMAILFIRRIT